MKQLYKYFLLFILLIITGCHYHKSDLVIHNKSLDTIYFSILIKNKDNTFYPYGAGQIVEPNYYGSPIFRGRSDGLKTEIDDLEDKRLSIAICKSKYQQLLFKNFDSMIKTDKVKVIYFSKKELDSMDWKVDYN